MRRPGKRSRKWILREPVKINRLTFEACSRRIKMPRASRLVCMRGAGCGGATATDPREKWIDYNGMSTTQMRFVEAGSSFRSHLGRGIAWIQFRTAVILLASHFLVFCIEVGALYDSATSVWLYECGGYGAKFRSHSISLLYWFSIAVGCHFIFLDFTIFLVGFTTLFYYGLVLPNSQIQIQKYLYFEGKLHSYTSSRHYIKILLIRKEDSPEKKTSKKWWGCTM